MDKTCYSVAIFVVVAVVLFVFAFERLPFGSCNIPNFHGLLLSSFFFLLCFCLRALLVKLVYFFCIIFHCWRLQVKCKFSQFVVVTKIVLYFMVQKEATIRWKARHGTLEWRENCAQPNTLLLTTDSQDIFEIQCKWKPRVMFRNSFSFPLYWIFVLGDFFFPPQLFRLWFGEARLCFFFLLLSFVSFWQNKWGRRRKKRNYCTFKSGKSTQVTSRIRPKEITMVNKNGKDQRMQPNWKYNLDANKQRKKIR